MKTTFTKQTIDGGKIIVNARLNDECNNGHYEFAITANIYSPRGRIESGGCQHEEIVKYFPELQLIVDLHLSDIKGVPMYAVESGMYHIAQDLNKGLECLRLRFDLLNNQKEKLQAVAILGDKDMFYSLLVEFGAYDKRQSEALAGMRLLDCLDLYGNPQAEARVQNYQLVGVPSIHRIKCLIKQKEKKAFDDAKAKAEANHAEKIQKENRNHEIKMAILDVTMNDNWIYYSHTNTVCIHWNDRSDKMNDGNIEAIKKIGLRLDFSVEVI